jgi:RNA polymerase-associated protein RTF1
MMISREKYEAEEQKNKEKELKKKLAASQGVQDEDMEDGEEEEEVQPRRGGRSRESDRRKEALASLKSTKSKVGSDKARSMLRDRLGDDSDDDTGRHDDLVDRRRKRQDLQRGRRRHDSGSDDGSFSGSQSDDSGSRRHKKSKTDAADGGEKLIKSALLLSLEGPKLDEEPEMKPDEMVPVTWHQANHYLLKKRSFFEKHYFEPFFDKLVKGVYVKIPIAPHDGKMVYRFCEVVGVTKLAKPYSFCGEQTHKGLVCAFGKSRLEWKISGLSSHSLTEKEFLVWRATLNKERIKLPMHAEAKRLVAEKKKLITKHKYTDEEVTEMVRRKNEVGHTAVSISVQRVRLERDIRAAQDMKNFEKAVKLEERLQKLSDAHERRLANKTEDVKRINEINQRNRAVNMQNDLQAQLLNDAVRDKMSHAEKLQFIRANAKKMYLSRDKVEKNLADGLLIKLEDGRIFTANKLHEIETLPDDLVRNKGVNAGKDMENGGVEIDIEKLLAKDRERRDKEAKKQLEASAVKGERDTKVEFVTGDGSAAPTSALEIANSAVRIQDDDGTWMTLRAANEIVKEKQSKPHVPQEAKAARRGISVKDYFDRVKKRRVGE